MDWAAQDRTDIGHSRDLATGLHYPDHIPIN